MKLDNKTLFLHKDCSSISIYALCMAAATENYRYVIKGYNDEIENSHYKFKDNLELEEQFSAIYLEYLDLVANINSFRKEKSRIKIQYMKYRYGTVLDILDLYVQTNEIEVLVLVGGSIDYEFDIEKPVGPQLDDINKVMIGLKNKIKIAEARYKAKYEKENKQQQDYDISKEILKNLDSQALTLETNLKLGYNIDIKKTSVVRWVNLNHRLEALT